MMIKLYGGMALGKSLAADVWLMCGPATPDCRPVQVQIHDLVVSSVHQASATLLARPLAAQQ